MIQTTGTQPKVVQGGVVLEVHALIDGQVEVFTYDVDNYALELANALLGAIVDRNEQRSRG